MVVTAAVAATEGLVPGTADMEMVVGVSAVVGMVLVLVVLPPIRRPPRPPPLPTSPINPGAVLFRW